MVKSETAFRTISEVSTELDVPQHVLRFWEGRFAQIRPLKRAGGRRYYRPDDVEVIRRIRDLLYREGYTIKGVRKLLKEKGAEGDDAPSTPSEPAPSAETAAPLAELPKAQALAAILDELMEMRRVLDAALGAKRHQLALDLDPSVPGN
ncbi:MAG: MerR family transcriptional regulator [Rhodospirillales bacterium]|nr:MerR family transcriptional regulator [Rhodospirillales bacterium]